MAMYIDVDLLKDTILGARYIQKPQFLDTEEALAIIDSQPTADVVEVKHGKWHLLDECANEGVYCSVCHKKVYRTEYANQKIKSKFCPNCGAKMDGKDTNVPTK